jgi:hypothetical protein
MAAKIFTLDLLDRAKILLDSGSTYPQAANILGCHPHNLSIALRNTGYTPPHVIAKQEMISRCDAAIPEISKAYNAGESVKSLSNRFGFTRESIRQRLAYHGVPIRGGSEANIVSMQAMTPEQRAFRVSKARDTRFAAMRKSAMDGTSAAAIGIGEREITSALRSAGYEVDQQFPVNGYMIDFVFGDVAVEIKCNVTARFTVGAGRERERAEKIIEAGFKVCFVVINSTDSITLASDQLIALLEVVRRSPPCAGKYWMIRSAVENFAAIYRDRDDGAVVPVTPEILTSITQRNLR